MQTVSMQKGTTRKPLKGEADQDKNEGAPKPERLDVFDESAS